MLSTRAWIAGVVGLLVTFQLIWWWKPHEAVVGHWSASSGHGDRLQAVMNETLGFQKIFVINLPTRWDHRDGISLASRLSDLHIDFLDGATDVDPKLLPGAPGETGLNKGALGNWRSWVNAARLIVEQNITSALVLEDDADWDVHLKSQMQDFAKASQSLLRPDSMDDVLELKDLKEPETLDSPYGDSSTWDILWLGHCGADFVHDEGDPIPRGTVIVSDDQTVPESQHLDLGYASHELTERWPNQTRIISRAKGNVCTQALALSQKGAQRVLQHLGMEEVGAATDLLMRQICAGARSPAGHIPNCLTVHPALIGQFRPVGSKSRVSDISAHPEGAYDFAHIANIRWSTRLNIKKLLYGDRDYTDQFPDGAPARKEIED